MAESKRKKEPGRPKKFTVEKFIEGIRDTGGLRSQIAENLGCSEATVYTYIREHPEIQKALEEEENRILDMAEGALFSLIQSGDTSAIFYYLNNKGRKRGYGVSNKYGLALQENEGEKEKTGVLVTPGLLNDTDWEKAANSAVEKNEKCA